MAFQTDVGASQEVTATGVVNNAAGNPLGRCRIKGFYIVSGASAGSVVLNDGNGGPLLIRISTPTAANQGAVFLTLPGEGILASNAVFATVTNAASAIIFWG